MTLPNNGLLLTAQVVLLLAAANYGLPNAETFCHEVRPAPQRSWLIYWLYQAGRALAVAVGVAALAGWHGAFLLALVSFWLSLVLAAARALSPLRFRAEVEVLGASGLTLASWALVRHGGLVAAWPVAMLPMQPARRAAYLLSAALLLYILRGGTWIVRGILERGGSMPPALILQPGDDPAVQAQTPRIQLNHGRMIGDIERIILTLFIANGQFAAIAFFFAGKALIRSKELEVRAWADYLLLGSLSSFLVALVAGILMSRMMQWY